MKGSPLYSLPSLQGGVWRFGAWRVDGFDSYRIASECSPLYSAASSLRWERVRCGRRNLMYTQERLLGASCGGIAALPGPLRGVASVEAGRECILLHPGRRVGRCCWKTVHGFAMTLAAAGLEPNDPAMALRVGQYAAAGGLSIAAEAWFRRAVGLGRRAKDHVSHTQAWVPPRMQTDDHIQFCPTCDTQFCRTRDHEDPQCKPPKTRGHRR